MNKKALSSKKTKIIAAVAAVLISALVGYITFDKLTQSKYEAMNIQEDEVEFGVDATIKVHEARDVKDAEGPQAGIDMLEGYLQDNPNLASRDKAYVYSYVAHLYAEQGNYEKALENSMNAIENSPSDPRYYAYTGGYYYYQENIPKATEYYRKALEQYDSGLPEGYEGPDREHFERQVQGIEGIE